jgi:hypothetical protein
MPTRPLRNIAFLAAIAPAASASAQWRTVVLQPDGVAWSQVLGNAGAVQCGQVMTTSGVARPVLWTGEGRSYIDLLPAGFWTGVALGMDGYRQVGFVSSRTAAHAVIWYGSADSYVDLSPAGEYAAPQAEAVAGDQQTGSLYSTNSGMRHAALWYGSAASFVDLHPDDIARWSQAFATDGTQQGGWVDIRAPGVGLHAALWSGSAASFVDMHPPGASQSVIRGMATGAQVGEAEFPGQARAALWHGTPASFVDLHPPGAQHSFLRATTGTHHVGEAWFTGNGLAGIWTGDDPSSFHSLHQYLGPPWWSSSANSVTVHNGRLYVAGSAARTANAEAMLWISDPLCPGDASGDGVADLTDLATLLIHFGMGPTPPQNYAAGDFDDDADVDLADLAVILTNFGTACE